jgi:hypothetical protein
MPETKASPALVRFEGFQLDLRTGALCKDSAETILSLAITLADRRINNLQQDFQSVIWYDPVPCAACFSSASER